MASDNHGVQTTAYACKCLNVRIIASQAGATPLEDTRDPCYIPVFVQDDGISVTHPQVTVRLTSKGELIPGTSKCSRFTALTCLLCGLAIYRVHQVISLDVEGNESTLFPTEDWVEQDIMKSANGFIDVHKDSLVEDSISNAERSSSYVPSFSLVLPPNAPSPPSSPKMDAENLNLPKPSSPEGPPPTYLSEMRSLFLPPPFTSSHPIFVHLASIATTESQSLRATAEQRISDFVKAETAGIEVKEKELKRQVEALWKSFRRNISAVEQERNGSTNRARSPSRVKDISTNGFVNSPQISSSVMIRSFVPQPISPAPLTSSSSLPRISALSASLATSSFHHPRELQLEHSISDSNGSNGSSVTALSTPRSGSSTLVHPGPRGEGTNVLQFKRNINDTVNTQASYRYFVNLDEDMARYKRDQEKTQKKQREVAESARPVQEAGPSHNRRILSPNGTSRPGDTESQVPPADAMAQSENETTPLRGRDKGKRKVTFDVQPAVATIQNKEESPQEGAKNENSQEMIFPLEDLEGKETIDKPANAKHSTLPLLEQPISRPFRARTARQQNNAALEAFSSLRPASLPNPSHIRPMRSQPGVDSSSPSGMMLNLPKPNHITSRSDVPSRTASSSSLTPLNEHDAAILKLVAADTPSHRGAWTQDSKAWQTFTRRQDNLELKNITDEQEDEEGEHPKHGSVPAVISTRMKTWVEDGEDEGETEASGSNLPAVGSLPVSILKRVNVKEPLNLASYRPPPAIPEHSAVPPSPGSVSKLISSTAIRKAAYAERDRNRLMDPGTLDFAAEEDDEEDESDNSDLDQPKNEADAGEKARKRALKILQARSELPGEGMWRSLA